MVLRNAFGALSTEAKQDDVIAQLEAAVASLSDVDAGVQQVRGLLDHDAVSAAERLSQIRDKLLGTLDVLVTNFPAVQAVSAETLPLPDGAATNAKVNQVVDKLSDVITQLQNIHVEAAEINIDSENINLNTVEVESLLTQVRDRNTEILSTLGEIEGQTHLGRLNELISRVPSAGAASAAKQDDQVTRLETIRDRIGEVTGQTVASLLKAVRDRLPSALDGGKLSVTDTAVQNRLEFEAEFAGSILDGIRSKLFTTQVQSPLGPQDALRTFPAGMGTQRLGFVADAALLEGVLGKAFVMGTEMLSTTMVIRLLLTNPAESGVVLVVGAFFVGHDEGQSLVPLEVIRNPDTNLPTTEHIPMNMSIGNDFAETPLFEFYGDTGSGMTGGESAFLPSHGTSPVLYQPQTGAWIWPGQSIGVNFDIGATLSSGDGMGGALVAQRSEQDILGLLASHGLTPPEES